MNKAVSNTIKIILLTATAFAVQGCHSLPASNARPFAGTYVQGQDLIINYALDPASPRYITGKFVSITQDTITLETASRRKDGDQRQWHATIDLENVFMIQSAQK